MSFYSNKPLALSSDLPIDYIKPIFQYDLDVSLLGSNTLIVAGVAYEMYSRSLPSAMGVSGEFNFPPEAGTEFYELFGPTLGGAISVWADFSATTVENLRDYIDIRNVTEILDGEVAKGVQFNCKQRSTAPGGSSPPQTWLWFSRPLINGLPQADLPELGVEFIVKLPKSLATSLVFPSSGSDDWFSFFEIKSGHGNDGLGTTDVEAGDWRIALMIMRDEVHGNLELSIKFDDGGNNSDLVMPGVTPVGQPRRVLRETYVPLNADEVLGKKVKVKLYIKRPANVNDVTTGILFLSITPLETNVETVVARWFGYEQIGGQGCPMTRFYLAGAYSGGNAPYSATFYSPYKIFNKFAYDPALLTAPLTYNDAAAFFPLKYSLHPTKGSGSGVLVRATPGWVFNDEGKLIEVPAHVPMFYGARYIINLFAASDTLATQGVTTTGDEYTVSFYGTGTIAFTGAYAGADLVGTGLNNRVQRTFTATAGTVTCTITGSCKFGQFEKVTGKADQGASEYVSNGTLGYPYHGCGVDGVRALGTAFNGTAISEALLLGLAKHKEDRENDALYSNDLTNGVWAKVNMSADLNQISINGKANSGSLITATANDATILQNITAAAAAGCLSAYVTRGTGTGFVYMTRDGGSTWVDITSLINNSTATRIKIENTSVLNPQIGFKIATSGDSLKVNHVQNELGTECSLPIPTLGTAVTRNLDAVNYRAVYNLYHALNTMAKGVMMATVTRENWANGNGSIMGSVTNGLLTSSANSGVSSYDGANAANGPTGTPTGTQVIGVRYSGSTLEAFSNGVFGTPATYDGDFNLGTTSNTAFEIGVGVSCFVKNVAVWDVALTNEDLAEVLTA